MRRVTTVAEVRAEVAAARRCGDRIGLVPTMGALHEGHLSLVRQAAGRADTVVVSIFVNPLQFGAGEDLSRYPRDLGADEDALLRLGDAVPALVYAPTLEAMYPGYDRATGETGIATTVSVRGLSEALEGASRPGHLDGVCTVVAKLFHQVQPDLAVFGRKDHQQLQVIRRMVGDLDLPVEVVAVPTVRAADGVAVSSRNAYLDRDERVAARCLPRALAAAVRAARQARSDGQAPAPAVVRDAAWSTIAAEPRARVDYVAVADPHTLEPLDVPTGPSGHQRGEVPQGGPANASPVGPAGEAGAERGSPSTDRRMLVAVAVRIGPARLIDNVVVGDEHDEQRLLAAVGAI